jgi:hypothetical protein
VASVESRVINGYKSWRLTPYVTVYKNLGNGEWEFIDYSSNEEVTLSAVEVNKLLGILLEERGW